MRRLTYIVIFISFSLYFFSNLAFSSPRQVVVLTIEDNIINPIIAEYIKQGIEKATRINAQALIIKLDTPGGLLSSTRNIVKDIMEDKVPVIVYVSPKGARAASAGTFITLSANIACMAPSTSIGAAHPVVMGSGGIPFKKRVKEKIENLSKEEKESEDVEKERVKEKEEEIEFEPSDVMGEKIMSDTVTWIKNIAKSRGRNVNWAVKAVEKSASISEKEALEEGVIDLVADDVRQLLEKIDGMKIILNAQSKILHTKNTQIESVDMSGRQKFLNTITHPNIAYILMILGFYALLFEITHPGFGVPGIGGLICLILAFYALQVFPINFAGLGLIILAIILFITEAFTPTFGLLTIGGIICMSLGSLILIDSPYEFMQVSLKVIIPVVIATGGITLFLVGNVIRTRKNKISSGKEGLIGEIGETQINITSKKGKVFVHGEIWNAVSKTGDTIKKGEKVEVVKVEGLKLIVTRINTGLHTD